MREIKARVDDRVDFPLAVTGASVHFERVESAVFRHVIDGSLADAELVGNLFLGESLVFLRLNGCRLNSIKADGGLYRAPYRDSQIIPGMVPVIPFWVPSFPF